MIEELPNILVEDILTFKPLVIDGKTKIIDAARLMKKYNQDTLIISGKSKEKILYEGIITGSDFRNYIARGRFNKNDLIEKIMSTPLLSIDSRNNLDECLDFMKRNGIKHVPIIENGALKGIVGLKEILLSDSSIIVETKPLAMYLIHNKNGLLIFEYLFQKNLANKKISGDFLSGALVSFDTLLPQILGSKGKLKVIAAEDNILLIEHGKYCIAILLQDKESIDSRKRLKLFLEHVEDEYEDKLENYDERTPTDVFNNVKNILENLFIQKI